MHQRIEVEAADRSGGPVGKVHFGFRADVIGMLEAAGLVRHEAAAVRKADFKRRVALQHAAEHQTSAGNRGLERQSHEISHVIGAQAFGARAGRRMHKDEGAEPFRFGPERVERAIVEIAAVDMGADHGAAQAELRHCALELIGRRLRRLQRHGAEAEKASGMAAHDRRDLLVLEGCAG